MIIRSLPALVVIALAAGACGGSDTPSADEVTEPVATTASEESTDEVTGPDEPVATTASEETTDDATPTTGSGRATMTISDGTVYEFEMTTCDTSNNSDAFLVEPGYDLSGRTDDGFRVQLIRAAFEEPTTARGGLEGRFDDNGVNPEVSYTFREPESVIALDGDTITADLVMSGFISQDPIHGEDPTAMLTVTC